MAMWLLLYQIAGPLASYSTDIQFLLCHLGGSTAAQQCLAAMRRLNVRIIPLEATRRNTVPTPACYELLD